MELVCIILVTICATICIFGIIFDNINMNEIYHHFKQKRIKFSKKDKLLIDKLTLEIEDYKNLIIEFNQYKFKQSDGWKVFVENQQSSCDECDIDDKTKCHTCNTCGIKICYVTEALEEISQSRWEEFMKYRHGIVDPLDDFTHLTHKYCGLSDEDRKILEDKYFKQDYPVQYLLKGIE